MESPELLVICGVAFFFVFALLAFLALIMRLIIFVFPEKMIKTDAAVIAAVSGAVQSVFPGTKITNIEEKK
jgi:hypothetical protein